MNEKDFESILDSKPFEPTLLPFRSYNTNILKASINKDPRREETNILHGIYNVLV
jgi:hypothetical protein